MYIKLAGVSGFEPDLQVLETRVLATDTTPLRITQLTSYQTPLILQNRIDLMILVYRTFVFYDNQQGKSE